MLFWGDLVAPVWYRMGVLFWSYTMADLREMVVGMMSVQQLQQALFVQSDIIEKLKKELESYMWSDSGRRYEVYIEDGQVMSRIVTGEGSK